MCNAKNTPTQQGIVHTKPGSFTADVMLSDNFGRAIDDVSLCWYIACRQQLLLQGQEAGTAP